jgi:hypothetical protein
MMSSLTWPATTRPDHRTMHGVQAAFSAGEAGADATNPAWLGHNTWRLNGKR